MLLLLLNTKLKCAVFKCRFSDEDVSNKPSMLTEKFTNLPSKLEKLSHFRITFAILNSKT